MLLAIFIHIPTALRRSKGLLFALNRFDRGSSLGYNNLSSWLNANEGGKLNWRSIMI